MRHVPAFCLAALLAFCAFSPAQAQPAGEEAPEGDAPFLRFPAVRPDGQQVAFSYQGDVWTVPTSGGAARRLTVNEAYESRPHWRPDGGAIAFMSDRSGNDDLFVMGADGARPQRLTYHSASDHLGGWTPEGDLLFTTDRTYVQVEWEEEVQRVSAEGGTPDRFLDALGYAPTMSPDGRLVALERGSSERDRKGYRGPANRDLWIYDREAEAYRQLTDFEGSDYQPIWTGPRTLLFLSERGGTYNIYRQRLTDQGTAAGAPQALTTFDEGAVRSFSASADGGQVVAFARNTHVYTMRRAGEGPEAGYDEAQRLRVDVPRDYRFEPVERETFTEEAEEYAVSPGGAQVAFVVHGEVFLRPNDPSGGRTMQLTDHPYRDRDVAWLDEETLLFASDRRGGQYDFYRLTSADDEEPSLYRALEFDVAPLTDTEADERAPVVAPDSQHVAFRRGRGQLVTAALTDDGALGEETVLLDGWATPEGVAWSPDSRWLAYSKPDLDFNHEVYIRAASGEGEPVNVSQHPRPDSDPVWSPDGSKLGFISSRSSGDDDVWFAWLREEDWEKTQRDWQLQQEVADEEARAADSTQQRPDTVEIDVEGLYERLEQVTARPGNEDDPAISQDGETFYFVAGQGGRTQDYNVEPDLFQTKWDGTETKRLTEGGADPQAVRLGPTGEHLFMMQEGGTLARVSLQGEAQKETLAFQAQMRVDHEAERRQVFSEAWRTLEKNFYDPDYHGSDWPAMREQYRPWALRASTGRDFRDVMNWMLGELNASHMGFYSSDRAETQEEETGLLGVAIDPVEEGVRIERVVPESPAARATSRLREGEVITAVGGTPVPEAPNFYALLTGKAEERVLLTVQEAGGDETRQVTLRAAADLDRELYQEWVEERRRLTEAYSDGQLGYVHIEGMNWQSFERFEREITASGEGKEGLVVDVRYNGGGWTTDYLLAVLTVRRHAYTVPRGAAENLDEQQTQFRGNYPFGERLPFAAWTGHVAALCNQNSYSNAEIFSHAFKSLGLGPLVGTPTFGAVISTGGRGLLGGSYVRVPFRGWYVYPTRQNMEHGPAVPDLVVENAPDAKATGQDEQLRRAVNALLEDIEQGREPRPGLSQGAPSVAPARGGQ